MTGYGVERMPMKDLKKQEKKVEDAIARVRARKVLWFIIYFCPNQIDEFFVV